MKYSNANLSELLEQSAWLKSLAIGLVRDDATADDVVQDAWVAAEQAGRTTPIQDPRGWFRRVVRNIAYRRYRDDANRRRREIAVARREMGHEDAGDIVERAETHARLVESLLTLDEPYRTTLLLRYFEDLSAQQIAKRDEVPVATVRTRIRRGLSHLRSRLGAQDRCWRHSVLSLAGADAFGGSSGVGAATVSASASISSLSLGGFIVSQKVLVSGIVGILAGAIGLSIGQFGATPDPEEFRREHGLVDQAELESARSRLAELGVEIRGLRNQTKRDAKTIAELNTRVHGLTRDLEEAETRAAAVDSKPALAIAGGKFGDLEVLRDADWPLMAIAVGEINETVLAILEGLENGAADDPEAFLKARQANAKLIPLAAALMGKIPTEVLNGNGEFSHPLVVSNLVDSILEHAEAPLSDAQRGAISELVESFDSAYAERKALLGEESPRLARIVEELLLKRDFKQGLEDLLSDDQLTVVAVPGIHNVVSADALSPAIMAAGLVRPVNSASRAAVVEDFARTLSSKYDLNDAQRTALAPAIEVWREAIDEHIVEEHAKKGVSLDAVIDAARAQAAVYEALLAMPGLSDAVRARILNGQSIVIPSLKGTDDSEE